jgi:hypothetical protein
LPASGGLDQKMDLIITKSRKIENTEKIKITEYCAF